MLGNIKAEFLSKKKLSPDTFEFTFLCKEPNAIDFLPGQYLIIVFDKEGETKRKYYSISSPLRQSESEASPKQEKSKLEFIVKIIENGVGSQYLINLKEGAEVLLQGPAGMFVLKDDTKQKVFIATGTGIAPILSMIRTYAEVIKTNFRLIWGIKKNEDLYYYDTLRSIAEKYNNFSFEIFISREEPKSRENNNILHGRVNIGIDKLLNNPETNKEELEFYISGDRDIVDSIREYLLARNILPEDIKLEKFI